MPSGFASAAELETAATIAPAAAETRRSTSARRAPMAAQYGGIDARPSRGIGSRQTIQRKEGHRGWKLGKAGSAYRAHLRRIDRDRVHRRRRFAVTLRQRARGGRLL